MLLIRVHKSLGHPAPKCCPSIFGSPDMIKPLVDGALEYQCDTCLESTELDIKGLANFLKHESLMSWLD